MSTLGDYQRDELRKCADALQEAIDCCDFGRGITYEGIRAVMYYGINDLRGAADVISDKHDENAKLRNLIRKAWRWGENGCHECPLEEGCKVQCIYDGDCGMVVEIEKGLQELGIEVGE